MLVVALFTLFGLLSPGIRRPLARTFMLTAVFWSISLFHLATDQDSLFLGEAVIYVGLFLVLSLLITSVRPGIRAVWAYLVLFMLTVWWLLLDLRLLEQEATPMALVTAFTCAGFMVLINGYYGLVGQSEDPPQDDGGIAQERPPQLWDLWVLQFIAFLVLGLLCFYEPDGVVALLVDDTHDHLATHFVDDQMRVLAAWILAMALLSYFSLGIARDWIWRGFGWLYAMSGCSSRCS